MICVVMHSSQLTNAFFLKSQLFVIDSLVHFCPFEDKHAFLVKKSFLDVLLNLVFRFRLSVRQELHICRLIMHSIAYRLA